MGEISFSFKAVAEPRHETAFQYSYANSIEYGFTYERCIALSNTSILNSPVSIIKVATGLSVLYPLFIDKMTHSIIYQSSLIEFGKIEDDISQDINKKEIVIDTNPYLLKGLENLVNTYKPLPYGSDIYEENIYIKRIKRSELDVFEPGKRINIYDYLNIDKNLILEKISGIDLSIYKKGFMFHRNLKVIKQKDFAVSFSHKRGLSLYDVYIATPPTDRINIIKTFIFGKRDLIANYKLQFYRVFQDKSSINVIQNLMISPESSIVINMLKNIYTTKERQSIYVLDTLFASGGRKGFSILNQLIAEKTKLKNNLSKITSGTKPIKNSLMYDVLGAGNDNKKITLNHIDSFGLPNKKTGLFEFYDCINSSKESDIYKIPEFNKSVKSTIESEWLNGSFEIGKINLFNLDNIENAKIKDKKAFIKHFSGFDKFNNKSTYLKDTVIYKDIGSGYTLYENMFAAISQKHSLLFNYISLKASQRHGDIQKNRVLSSLAIGTKIDSFDFSFEKFRKEMQFYFIESIAQTNRFVFDIKDIWSFKEKAELNIDKIQQFSQKEQPCINKKDTGVLIYREDGYTNFLYGQSFINKDKPFIHSDNNFIAVTTNSKEINHDFNFISIKRKTELLWELTNAFISKDLNSSSGPVNTLWGKKKVFGVRKPKQDSIGKFKKEIDHHQALWGLKTNCGFSVFWQINNAIKQTLSIRVFAIDNFIKNRLSMTDNRDAILAFKANGRLYLDYGIGQGTKITQETNALKQDSAYKLIDNSFIHELISANIYYKNIFIEAMSSLDVSDRQTNVFDICSLDSSTKTIDNILKSITPSKHTKSFIENKWIHGKTKIGQVHSFSVSNGTKRNKTFIENNMLSFEKFDKQSLYERDLYGYKNTNTTYSFDIGTFAITECKDSIVFKDTSVSFSYANLNTNQIGTWSKKFSKKAQESFIKSLDSVNKFIFEESKKLLLSKHDKETVTDKKHKSAKKEKFGIKVNKTGLWVYPENRAIQNMYHGFFIGKDKQSFIIQTTLFPVTQERRSAILKADFLLFAEKTRKSIETFKNAHTYRKKNELWFDNYDTGTHRTLYSIPGFIDAIWLNKGSLSIVIPDNIKVKTKRRSIEFNKELQVLRNHRDISMFKQINSIFRKAISIETLDIDTVIRNNISIDFMNDLNNGFAGTLVPISKVRNQIYIDNVTNTCIRSMRDIDFLNKDIVASIIDKPLAAPDTELFFDSNSHDIYIDTQNTALIKSKIKLNIRKDASALLDSHSMTYRDAVWAKKDLASIWIDSEINAFKAPNDLNIKDTLTGAIKDKNRMYVYKTLFIETLPKLCYYDFDTWADRESIKLQIQQQTNAFKDNHDGRLLDMIPSAVKDNLEIYYDKVLFSQRQLRDCKLLQEIDEVKRISKEMSILPNDGRNWAWVYETPDPIQETIFGIDELLLPENDTRYQDFEDIIFDKANMQPKNPVKEIDSNTFIAKFPTKHPIPDYDKIGIVYIDVETSIMQTIFLKFYRIWQTKVFEFGSMTMTQSTKKMLEYMYTWIMEYFPIEQLEQALRVFRLIRWYAETSIIRNSQYIITYEYGLLESKLNTGKCLVPNDLDTNDSMYVDAKLGIIKNNPAYIGSYAAHVTFTVSNKKNTSFTFSLSNTIGSVNIYLNDKLIDKISKSALNITYQLPYNGDDNVIKIEKTKENNLNGTFYIGNIKIPNGTFKDLNIEFDPTLKAGNKPLNEIAQKMMIYANLYENRNEMYTIMREGNLGIGETYKRLEEYWKLHHQDKVKGKRLTIKEV